VDYAYGGTRYAAIGRDDGGSLAVPDKKLIDARGAIN